MAPGRKSSVLCFLYVTSHSTFLPEPGRLAEISVGLVRYFPENSALGSARAQRFSHFARHALSDGCWPPSLAPILFPLIISTMIGSRPPKYKGTMRWTLQFLRVLEEVKIRALHTPPFVPQGKKGFGSPRVSIMLK